MRAIVLNFFTVVTLVTLMSGSVFTVSAQNLNQITGQLEKLLEKCDKTKKKNDRCADHMYALGALYYDQAKESTNDYSKSLQMYRRLIKEYPNFPKLSDAKNMLATIEIIAQIETTGQEASVSNNANNGGKKSDIHTQTQQQQPTAQTVNSGRPSETLLLNELNAAIRDASHYLNKNIPKGSKIVILNIQSDSSEFSDYIIDELIANAINDKVFTVIDRQQLDIISAEQNFQMSGAVDDNEALAIGKFLGAQTIISGAVSKIGTVYRIRIRALEVQTAKVQGQYNRNIDPNPNTNTNTR
jgi:TolB-like protein